MVDDAYREFFVAVAGATGALVGLLFVAVTVSPDRAVRAETRVEFRSQASTSLLLFTNALVLSLAALIPGVTLGWWALALAVIILAFAAATARLLLDDAHDPRALRRSLVFIGALVVIAGVEIYGGVEQLRDSRGTGGLQTLDYVLIAELTAGIARAWQLVGLRDTGIVTSLRTLAHGEDVEQDEPTPT